MTTIHVSAELDGWRDWEAALERKEIALGHANERATREAARVVERAGKKTLRRYTHPKGTPTTSPPGEPPALVSGDLMRSYKTRGPKPGRKPGVVLAEVGPTMVYSRIQELGGRTGAGYRSRLPARPYHAPATNSVRRDVRRVYVVRFREALRA